MARSTSTCWLAVPSILARCRHPLQTAPRALEATRRVAYNDGVKWLLLIAWIVISGCTTEILHVDPPVTWKATGNDCLGDGGEEVVLGMYHEQMFTPFGDEPDAAIRTGFQGGVWCMPAVRVLGTEPAVRVIAEIKLDDGTVAARSVYAHYELKLAPDGKCEEQQLPIQVTDQWAKKSKLPELYGKKATLHIVLQNKGDKKTIEKSAPIVLVEG